MNREIGDYLQDILEAMTDAIAFTDGMKFKDFCEDTKTVYAVIRAIEVIGEATKNIPTAIRNKYPDIPWKEMAGMRDKLIHEYFGISLERLWFTVNKDIPGIKPNIINVIREFNL